MHLSSEAKFVASVARLTLFTDFFFLKKKKIEIIGVYSHPKDLITQQREPLHNTSQEPGSQRVYRRYIRILAVMTSALFQNLYLVLCVIYVTFTHE